MTKPQKRKSIIDSFKAELAARPAPPTSEEIMLAVVNASLLYRSRMAMHRLTKQDKAGMRVVIKRATHLIVEAKKKERINGL